MTSARSISGATIVAGVVGAPVAHSLSPLIHNAWIAAAGIDAVYVAFSPPPGRFAVFVEGLRGGAVRGLNVTAPFKDAALTIGDKISDRAKAIGAANLLIFEPDGAIVADNTDGVGLLAAFADQAPGFDPAAAPAMVLGAGGAARAAVAAFLGAGAPEVRVVNRSPDRAQALSEILGSRVRVFIQADEAMADAGAVINATTLGLGGGEGPAAPLENAPAHAVVMDMIYRPLRTAFLGRAADLGLRTVDGLAMLIGQAEPSFQALFGMPPPAVDVRAIALAALEGRS